MKTIKHFYDNLSPLESLTRYASKDDILYFDIEKTGLSRVKNHIYLIGCGYYTENGLNIIQWFAENEQEEKDVLVEFFEFSSSFNTLVNYNGKSFDIPFTTERANRYGLEFPDFDSIDIYTMVKPLKKILSLSDTTQKSVESFLGIKRTDKYNGGELIYVYLRYVKSNIYLNRCTNYYAKTNDEFKRVSSEQESCFEKLICHNLEDVLNMHYLSDITAFNSIFDGQLSYTGYELREYTDYNGNLRTELILNGTHDFNVTKSINSFYSDESGLSYIMVISDKGSVSIRVPVTSRTLNYYIPNYKDYYYLVKEQMCIYKSMASSVSKENRINATKENCFTLCESSFVPVKSVKKFKELLTECDKLKNIHFFRESYKSKNEFIKLDELLNTDCEFVSCFFNCLFDSFK